MKRFISLIMSLLISLFIHCGLGPDPDINLPDFKDPAFITTENYDFDGRIASLRSYCQDLASGKTRNIGAILTGVVLNDYDSSVHGVYHDKGFFIQDQNSGFFIRSKDGISVKRGDKIELSVISVYRSSCNTCDLPFKGRLQIKDYYIRNTLSTGNLIYCTYIKPDTNYSIFLNGPFFTRVRGLVSKKSSDNVASWGMDNNLWGIRLPVETERSFPDVYPGDDIIAYGIFESYGKVADGEVIIPFPLWVYDTKSCIFDFTIE